MTASAAMFLFAWASLGKGLAALIQTQQTVMAAVGGEALLSCQLTESKEVLQVTWQKLLPNRKQNFATYSGRFGETVDSDFRDKVKFKDAGLQRSSITISSVTEQDEGCYHCLFNTYPKGALTGTTCLRLYELHGPVLHVAELNSTEETVVSCSATGRPAPTVTLRVLRHNVHYSSDSVDNANGTVTVTATAVLPRFHDNSTQVGCAVGVPSAPQKEVSMMMPAVKKTSADGSNFASILVAIVVAYVVAAIVIVFLTLNVRCEKRPEGAQAGEDKDKTTDTT
ncbi:OX-2 membrane glycoprotein-like [Symphorus nematophorus]